MSKLNVGIFSNINFLVKTFKHDLFYYSFKNTLHALYAINKN